MSSLQENYQSDQVTILHNTRNKFRQLASSLLLTSSLINNKLKINKSKQEKHQSQPPLTAPSPLTTSKINIENKNCLQSSQNTKSNIQELKYLAKKLDQDQIIKMGKQNANPQSCEPDEKDKQNLMQIVAPKIRQRKLNKRKIVKGRPQMYAFIKKRKLLPQLPQPKLSNNNLPSQIHIRQTINEILNKDQQVDFLCAKFDQRTNHHEYVKLVREKSQQFVELPTQKKKYKLRKSLSSFKTIESCQRKGMMSNGFQNPLGNVKNRHLSLGNNRLSSSNTIQ